MTVPIFVPIERRRASDVQTVQTSLTKRAGRGDGGAAAPSGEANGSVAEGAAEGAMRGDADADAGRGGVDPAVIPSRVPSRWSSERLPPTSLFRSTPASSLFAFRFETIGMVPTPLEGSKKKAKVLENIKIYKT